MLLDYCCFCGETDHCRNKHEHDTCSNKQWQQFSVVSVWYWPCQCQWWRKRGPLPARLPSLYRPHGSCWPGRTKREAWIDLNWHPPVQCEHVELCMHLDEAAEQAASRQGGCQRPPEDSRGTRWDLHRVGDASREILHPLWNIAPLQASVASN